MKIRKISLITTLLLIAPMFSHADTAVDSDMAMDACVKAFISTNVEKARPITVKKEEFIGSAFARHNRTGRISMKAVDNSSGEQVAKATCVFDRSGVMSMNGKPVMVLAQKPEVLSSR